MRFTFDLSLPRDSASVPVARHLAHDALIQLGVQHACVADIELALTEACTNVLRHANGQDDAYQVGVEIDDRSCKVMVKDLGVGFHGDDQGLSTSNEGSEGGRGIFLMRALVDQLDFESHGGNGTTVSLTKWLTPEGGSPLDVLADRDGDKERPASRPARS